MNDRASGLQRSAAVHALQPLPEFESLAERLVDRRPEPLTLRSLVGKVFLRPKSFLFALLVPPLIAMTLAALVPVDWSATTKILIRYGTSDTSLLRDISPDIRLGLSGTTSAELIKSTPVVEKTIEAVGIEAADIWRKPTDVLVERLTGPFRSRKDDAAADPAVARAHQVAGLARSLKESLESSSKKAGGAKSVEILDKPSQMPDALKLDELISLEVRSFNREKVAAMTNGLARAFIDEYYRIYGDEAGRQYRYLDGLVADEEKRLAAVQTATREELARGDFQSTSGKELVSRDVPILNSMAAQLMEVQGRLARATQVYAGGSPEVRRLAGQAADMKFMLQRQERIEIGKQVLEQLKLRRYQAYNTQTVYKDRLIPISIAESATTPDPSSTRKLSRIAVAGVLGTVLGLIFATSLMMVLGLLDPRIDARRDIEALVAAPVIGHFPERDGHFDFADTHAIADDTALESATLQVLTAVHRGIGANGARTIVVTAAAVGDGASFAALALAVNLAKNRGKRICLVDANVANGVLGKLFGATGRPGFVDLIRDFEVPDRSGGFKPYILRKELNLWVLPLGNPAVSGPLGYYADAARILMDRLRATFDTVVIDAGAALTSSEAVILGQLAERTVLVVSAGATRKGVLQAAADRLASSNVRVAGVVLNRSRRLLPGFIYRNIV